MAFTALQTLTAAQLNDLDITTITTSGNGTIGGDLTVTGTLNATVSASGSDGQIQYNNGGAFGGSSSLTFDDATGDLTVGGSSQTTNVAVTRTGTSLATPGVSVANSGGSGDYNYFLNASNDAGVRAVMFVNGSTRTADGGTNTMTIRNDGGRSRFGNSSYVTTIAGSAITLENTATATNFSVGTGSSANGFIGGSNYWRPQDAYGNSYFDINSGQFYVDSDTYYFRNRSSVNSLVIDSSGNALLTGSMTVNNNIYLRTASGVHDSIYRVGGIYFTWDSSAYGTNTQHSIRSTDGDTWSDDITINSYGNVRVNIDTNNNGSNSFYIQSHGTGTGNVILYVPDTGAGIYLEQGWFRAPDDNGFYFENHGTGMRSPISEGGNYGSVATYGGEGGWEGWSIGGRVVFMHNMSNNWGIYNDVNNEWMIYGALNGDVNLYHNNSVKLVTQSDGTETTGIHTSRRSSTSSNWSHMQFEAATGSTSNSTAGIAGHLPNLLAGVWRVWYGNGEGWDSGNSGGTGYRFVGASSFVTRSSERWKKNIHSRTDDEIIPTAMNLLSCRTAVWDENSLDPVCCEDGESFEEPEMCDDPNCDCECCTEIRNDPIQRRHFGRRGYIVEELEQVFPDAIFYERDGSPSGIDYSVITAELIDIVKLLVLQGDENNRRLSALEQP